MTDLSGFSDDTKIEVVCSFITGIFYKHSDFLPAGKIRDMLKESVSDKSLITPALDKLTERRYLALDPALGYCRHDNLKHLKAQAQARIGRKSVTREQLRTMSPQAQADFFKEDGYISA
jgi:hypothetical protein